MQIVILLLGLALAKFRMCALPSDIQSIKAVKNIHKYGNIIRKYFNARENDVLAEIDGFDVFMLFDNKEMAGYVKYINTKVYSKKERAEYDMLIIYSFTIVDEYQGRGLSYQMLADTIEYMRKWYGLSKNTILSLHLSPNDPKMPIASRIYYKHGFKNGMFIKFDPRELKYSIDMLFEHSRDMLDIIKGKEQGYGDGYYFMLYCKLKDFGKRKDQRITLEDTQVLFERLKNRKAEAK